MATRQVEPQPGYLKLGDEFESGYMALANKREITESGRLFLAELGDQLESGTCVNTTRMQSSQENKEGHRLSFALQRIVNVVDTVLEWLEHSGKNAVMSLKKQEMALRGVFHLTGEFSSTYNVTF